MDCVLRNKIVNSSQKSQFRDCFAEHLEKSCSASTTQKLMKILNLNKEGKPGPNFKVLPNDDIFQKSPKDASSIETSFESAEELSNAGETSTLPPNIIVQRGGILNYACRINNYFGTTDHPKEPLKEQMEVVQDLIYSGIYLCAKKHGVGLEVGDVKAEWKFLNIISTCTKDAVR